MKAKLVIVAVYVLLISKAYSTNGDREWLRWLAFLSIGLLGFGLGRATAGSEA
jgi:hypothetical protein